MHTVEDDHTVHHISRALTQLFHSYHVYDGAIESVVK
jgi:hypothetical protein